MTLFSFSFNHLGFISPWQMAPFSVQNFHAFAPYAGKAALIVGISVIIQCLYHHFHQQKPSSVKLLVTSLMALLFTKMTFVFSWFGLS